MLSKWVDSYRLQRGDGETGEDVTQQMTGCPGVPKTLSGDPRGWPAVLEVRAHDVPFLVEDGQVFFRLRYYRASGRPERVYAEGRSGRSYRHQDLTPARCFRPPAR